MLRTMWPARMETKLDHISRQLDELLAEDLPSGVHATNQWMMRRDMLWKEYFAESNAWRDEWREESRRAQARFEQQVAEAQAQRQALLNVIDRLDFGRGSAPPGG